jgi:subtilase family serine protease
MSLDALHASGDVLLSGSRTIPGLAASTTSSRATVATVPVTTPGGTYYLLACADDTQAVAETSETNNCRPADTQVTIVVVN